MTKVTAKEFQRGFGRYRTQAQREPVIVTHHGHDDLAVLAADEYERLKALDRQVFYAWEAPRETISAIADAEPSAEADQLNHLMD